MQSIGLNQIIKILTTTDPIKLNFYFYFYFYFISHQTFRRINIGRSSILFSSVPARHRKPLSSFDIYWAIRCEPRFIFTKKEIVFSKERRKCRSREWKTSKFYDVLSVRPVCHSKKAQKYNDFVF